MQHTSISLMFCKVFLFSVAPMASRNLPPSFFNAHYHAQVKAAGPAGHYSGPASDLYSSEAAYSGLHHLAAHHHAASGSAGDPWQYAAQVTHTGLAH